MADSADLVCTVGFTMKKPATSVEGVDKTVVVTERDGILFIISVEDAVMKNYVKDGKISLPFSKTMKAQSLVIRGKDQDFTIAKYISLKSNTQPS